MQLELTLPLAKRPFALYKMLLEPARREQMVTAAGARAVAVSVADEAVKVQREVETAVPPQLRNFLKQWNLVVQSEQWGWEEAEGVGSGQMSIKIQGVPLSIDGTATITAVDEGSLLSLDLLAYCGVPFVGPTLARAAAQMVRQNLEAELNYLAQTF